jgi:hypothetical protein
LKLIPLHGKPSIEVRRLLEACDMIVYRGYGNRCVPFALFLDDENKN